MQTNWNQLIERYLNNELSAEGKTAFENELANNKELQAEFDLHKLTTELIQRNSLRKIVQSSGKWYHLKKTMLKSGLTLLIVGAIAAVVYVAMTWKQDNGIYPVESEQIEQSLLEKLEKDLAFENIDPEYFQFTGKSDVFLSSSGVLLSLTEESFLLEGKAYKGEAIVQWQEAQTAADIVKAGLSSKSGDELLETQGMFSINAFTPNGKKLQLTNKGVYVQVPVDEVKNGMKLFTGVPQPNGGVDWQNPVELDRVPKPKDMTKMDLYPSRYEPKLDELKWFKEKSKRDSLYLSFEEDDPIIEDIPVIYSELWDADPKTYSNNREERGRIAFQYKCATCHQPHKESTGPKLFNVREKWSNGGAKEGSIYQWIADWSIAALADPYAKQVSGLKPTAMNKFPELKGKTDDIDAIFDYVDSQLNYGNDTLPRKKHIPPSKVLAIWNPKFNNTILATQDFEDRMKKIHETCDEKVFDVYVKNLNEPLWKLDERVVKMGYPQFQRFADQRVGKVKLDDVHQKNLTAFYEKAIEQLRETGKKNLETALKKERQWDNEVQDERSKEVLRRGLRESTNLKEEYDFNLKNVYRQLGVTAGFQIHGGGTIVNIDKYVMDATIARQSTVITDPQTGKTAQITYEPMKIEVKNAAEYDRLYLYLFSKEINSYQRLDFKDGLLEYNLNGDMNYSAALIGISEKGYYYHQVDKIKTGDLGTFSLQEVSEKEFDRRINALNSKRVDKPMSLKEELKWIFKEQANYVVQKKRRENQQFRNAIRPSIFSCGKEDVEETGIEMIIK